MRDRIFYTICFGFIFGVLVRSFLFVNLYLIILFGIIGFALLLFFSLISKSKWGIIVSIFVLASCFGIFRFHIADTNAPMSFESQVGQKVSLTGIISDEPDLKASTQVLNIKTRVGNEQTHILATMSLGKDFKYGDQINFSGKLEKPQNFMTDQGKEFDYVNYLRKDGILYVMSYPRVDIVSTGHGNFVKSILFSVKEKFEEKINLAIPKPESLLMGGLILGEKSSFDQALRQSFVNTGTIHIVALSGYNVTIVAEWIMKLFSFLPKNFGIGTGIFAIFIFIIMTGGSSTAIRAGIMATLALIARLTGRNYDVARALVLAGIIMILINPLILVYDVSFQLSFIATIAVILFSPKLEKYFYWLKLKWLRDIVSITVAAYIFVLPFILYKMGNLSLVALPANVLILPFIPATMLSGFLAGLAGFISTSVATPFVYLSYGLLHYELFVIGFFSRLPLAAIVVKNFPLTITIFIYIFFAYLLYKNNNLEKDNIEWKEALEPFSLKNFRSPIFSGIIILATILSGFLYYGHFAQNLQAEKRLQTLLSASVIETSPLALRKADSNCHAQGPLPDYLCTPGAVFTNTTPSDICVSGYTQTVRSVSTNLRKKVYSEYGVPYPQLRGVYEVDHLIPLELGGSNDIANLFLESAKPTPGFHEKDLVENFLNQEVCAGRADLARAQYQIATDWTAVYNNLTLDQITALKQQYRSY